MAQNLNQILQKIVEIQAETINKIKIIQTGYTPIKGVDYWTQEDKSQLVEQISERLLAEEF